MQQIVDPILRAKSALASGLSQYALGAGGYHPVYLAGELQRDDFFGPRERDGLVGVDCSAFGRYCHRLPSRIAGFNHGAHATVSDDLNTDSMIEDARYESRLFVLVNGWHPAGVRRGVVMPGDLLVYGGITGGGHHWIGHESIVLEVLAAFDPANPRWDLLRIAQAEGPDERSPAILETDGSIWNRHDAIWKDPRYPERSAAILRVRPDAAALARAGKLPPLPA